MNPTMNGWFAEICPLNPGLAIALEVDEVLYDAASPFQQIQVLRTKHHGRMLVLDGRIQLTEFDEFAYQEMLAHVPLFAHPNPESVLVIGGGDGGVLREVVRHDTVTAIDFCEIDEQVLHVSREFLPGLATGLDDPRVRIHIRDGAEFAAQQPGRYDVIIVDASDPVGPGESLYTEEFYRTLAAALKPGGIAACQGESLFLHQEIIQELVHTFRQVFPVRDYAWMVVPTYPGGHIGICLGSMGPAPAETARPMSRPLQEQLKYYTPEMHRAAFVLPRFARDLLKTEPVENG